MKRSWTPRRLVAEGALALVCLGMSVVAAPPAVAGPTSKVPDAPYPDEFRARVKKAISKAVEYIRAKGILDDVDLPDIASSADGAAIMKELREKRRYETAAAVLWVLRRAGAADDDVTVVKARKTVAEREPRSAQEAALLILGLCAAPIPSGDPFSTAQPAVGGAGPPPLAPADRPLVDHAVQYLLDAQIKTSRLRANQVGGWAATLVGVSQSDLSSAFTEYTFFALLGLEAAARAGVPVPPTTFSAALAFLLGRQQPDGEAVTVQMNDVRGKERAEWPEDAQARGFSSVGLPGQAEGYATAAGATAIAICQDALQKDQAFDALRPQARLALRDAFAWIEAHCDFAKNPTVGGRSSTVKRETLYYTRWLLALAQLEIHARVRLVGGHDWYAEGAEALLKTQRADGGWGAGWTWNCCSVLFLMRASLTSIAPVVTEPR